MYHVGSAHRTERRPDTMPASGLRLMVVHQLRSPNSTASSQSCPNLSVKLLLRTGQSAGRT